VESKKQKRKLQGKTLKSKTQDERDAQIRAREKEGERERARERARETGAEKRKGNNRETS
jgi:hypothetical protein